MPTRIFGCTACTCEFELFQGIKDETRPACPECGEAMRRLIPETGGFILRGPSGGWYGSGKTFAPSKKSAK